MAKFPRYSFNNIVLIASQRPDATLVAGYRAWQQKFGRHVKKNEHGIRIITPMPVKEQTMVTLRDPVTHEVLRDENGQPIKQMREVTVPRFKVATVFDVSQTEGKELPTPEVKRLQGKVPGYEELMDALRKISPVPIGFEEISGGAGGYYHDKEQRIAVRSGMSQAQTLKTVVHELAHATLHRSGPEGGSEKDKHTKEVEAESVAFAVSQAFGLDTSDYSFPYIASWTLGRELSELRSSMDLIRDTSGEMIRNIRDQLEEKELERSGIRYEIYQIREDSPSRDRMFMSYEFLSDRGWKVRPEDYVCVYSGKTLPENALEELFRVFNVDHPSDYTGRSVSTGDVIVLYGEQATAHYVDPVGFRTLEGFVSEPEIPAPIPDIPALAGRIDDLLFRYDRFSYNDIVEDRQEFLSNMEKDLGNGKIRDLREELEHIRGGRNTGEYGERAGELLHRMDEMVRDGTIPAAAAEEKVHYFVAENIGFPSLGEYREVASLQEAKALYDAMPSDRYPGKKGIGAVLTGNGRMTEIPLLSEGRVRTDLLLNESFSHSKPFRESIDALRKLQGEKTVPAKTEIKNDHREMSL